MNYDAGGVVAVGIGIEAFTIAPSARAAARWAETSG